MKTCSLLALDPRLSTLDSVAFSFLVLVGDDRSAVESDLTEETAQDMVGGIGRGAADRGVGGSGDTSSQGVKLGRGDDPDLAPRSGDGGGAGDDLADCCWELVSGGHGWELGVRSWEG